MQAFLTFVPQLLGDVCDFLLSDPISYFLGIFLLSGTMKLIKLLCNI